MTYCNETVERGVEVAGQCVVDDVNVLAEPVDNAARRRSVEEAHGRTDDTSEHS